MSVTGELLGVRAEHDRSRAEWNFQLATARSDLEQITQQVTGAEQQLALARRDAEIQDQEIAHTQAVGAFLKGRFAGAELQSWMSSQLAALYFQTYGMALELARAAEAAFRFERGLDVGETTFIRPQYWDSRHSGLLAGESLGVDLDRLANAYADTHERALEITKRVSLVELDPVAMLRLSSTGACGFALTEEVFDRDFPGHFRRQIRSVAVAFTDADGEPVQPNATLTQLGHKTVLAADPSAVRHLLDPTQPPPATLRSDWRAGQRIALSQVGDQENNGLFELRDDDPRYLPFEGTGAVSTWRLELPGRRPALRDVVLTVRYRATYGGEQFAAAVAGMLKPYPAALLLDVAAAFPEQWQAFLDGGELTLPLTPDLFPDMAGQQITSVLPHYQTTDGSAPRLVLNGDRTLTLTEGTALPTPGLSVRDDGDGWTFALDGDRGVLDSVALVLSYRAAWSGSATAIGR
jgi:hypothetical protein